MTRDQKLAYHLEMVIWETVPEGVRLNAKEIQALMDKATPEQKEAAFQRALVRVPLLIDEERERHP